MHAYIHQAHSQLLDRVCRPHLLLIILCLCLPPHRYFEVINCQLLVALARACDGLHTHIKQISGSTVEASRCEDCEWCWRYPWVAPADVCQAHQLRTVNRHARQRTRLLLVRMPEGSACPPLTSPTTSVTLVMRTLPVSAGGSSGSACSSFSLAHANLFLSCQCQPLTFVPSCLLSTSHRGSRSCRYRRGWCDRCGLRRWKFLSCRGAVLTAAKQLLVWGFQGDQLWGAFLTSHLAIS